LWTWIKKIAALRERKIVWDDSLDSPDTEVFAISVDGTDMRVWEKKHSLMNVNKKQCSQKFKHGAVKYEIALSVFKPQCIHLIGPFRGGEHDLNIWRKELKAKLEANKKKCIVDRGYKSKFAAERNLCAYPDKMDSKELNNFKSRARLRHETFRGRLKFFNSLTHTFKHGFDKHRFVMEAVVVTVQYQMDNGSPIFAV
jgi:hypothetical protein